MWERPVWLVGSCAIGGASVAVGTTTQAQQTVPEIPFDEGAFLQKVQSTVGQNRFCLVVVGEGLNFGELGHGTYKSGGTS